MSCSDTLIAVLRDILKRLAAPDLVSPWGNFCHRTPRCLFWMTRTLSFRPFGLTGGLAILKPTGSKFVLQIMSFLGQKGKRLPLTPVLTFDNERKLLTGGLN